LPTQKSKEKKQKKTRIQEIETMLNAIKYIVFQCQKERERTRKKKLFEAMTGIF
jgi:hypothetical protein